MIHDAILSSKHEQIDQPSEFALPGRRRPGVGGSGRRSCNGKSRLVIARQVPAVFRPGLGSRVFRTSRRARKRVIYLFQSGAPSQMDLFDPKPAAGADSRGRSAGIDPDGAAADGHDLAAGQVSRRGQPVLPSRGTARAERLCRELLPHTAKVVDDLCFIKSMHTEAINHDPAVTFFQTGAQLAGRPSIGSWVAYGLGSENQDLPAFVVMISRGSGNPNDQPLYDRLWGSGFLPTTYQGIKFRSVGDPVLYLSNPAGSFGRGPAANARRSGQARRAQSPRHSAIPRSSRASPNTRWPSGCRPRCRS